LDKVNRLKKLKLSEKHNPNMKQVVTGTELTALLQERFDQKKNNIWSNAKNAQMKRDPDENDVLDDAGERLSCSC
jgi:hypothetical protein